MINTNKKFPDMKALCDYIHGKGLKAGIYSSPGPTTCGGFTASYKYETQDAQRYAQWGFDYLKYDWCSYGNIAKTETDLPKLKKPYFVMRQALNKVNRDIVFSLCQYGMGDVWKWGAKWAATAGAPPATSATPGGAWPASVSRKTATKSTPAPAIGTIPTC